MPVQPKEHICGFSKEEVNDLLELAATTQVLQAREYALLSIEPLDQHGDDSTVRTETNPENVHLPTGEEMKLVERVEKRAGPLSSSTIGTRSSSYDVGGEIDNPNTRASVPSESGLQSVKETRSTKRKATEPSLEEVLSKASKPNPKEKKATSKPPPRRNQTRSSRSQKTLPLRPGTSPTQPRHASASSGKPSLILTLNYPKGHVFTPTTPTGLKTPPNPSPSKLITLKYNPLLLNITPSPIRHLPDARRTTRERQTRQSKASLPQTTEQQLPLSHTRSYLNAPTFGVHVLEGMKFLAKHRPEKPLKWLAEYLAVKSKRIEGDDGHEDSDGDEEVGMEDTMGAEVFEEAEATGEVELNETVETNEDVEATEHTEVSEEDTEVTEDAEPSCEAKQTGHGYSLCSVL